MAGQTGDLNIFLERVNILMYLWSGRERMKTRYYEVFYIILNTGMRIGELAALMWEDIDFLAHRIRIYKTLNKTTIFYDDSKRRIRWIQMKQKMKIPCSNTSKSGANVDKSRGSGKRMNMSPILDRYFI